MRYDLCLTIAYLVAGASFAESTECTVVELSIPVTPDEDDEGETEVANSSTESKATGTVSTTPVSQLKKRKVTHQDIQKMQLDVLNLEKIKIDLEVENLKLINQKLKLELEELIARKQIFVEY